MHLTITAAETTYTLRDGAAVELRHDGETFTLGTEPVRLPTCHVSPLTPRPAQPAGRAPIRHS
ncbi:MAG TPA: glycosyl hydrolase family 65 protein [Jatrophihabitantaceae bacterium]|nr:glycosyl hydrolase family 65 protein [Jatrophihabitantaceae bacterium]